jgi:hypothetical protein
MDIQLMATAQKVLWVWAHPDDETIAAGLSLRQHLERPDRDNYALILTRGEASGARAFLNGTATASVWGMPHNPAAEGYFPLTQEEFGAARMAETTGALAVLASGTGRGVTVFEGGLQDSRVVVADVMDAVDEVYAGICAPGEPLWLKTHSDLLPAGGEFLENVDHTAAGQACRQLSLDRPAIFGNLRLYVEPEHWADPVVVAKHLSPIKPVAGTFQATATLDAYEAFRAWAPPDRFAIGRHSVPGLFISPPENRYHT